VIHTLYSRECWSWRRRACSAPSWVSCEDPNRTWRQPRETVRVGRAALVVAMVCSTMASSCDTLLGAGHEWRTVLWKNCFVLCQRSSIRSRGRSRPVQ
ncbi:unnamed protein product, partial [Ectocarpus sp. 8 AP-2014]